MSQDQTDAFKRKMQEKGLLAQDDGPRMGILREPEGEAPTRPAQPLVRLPVDGELNSDFNLEIGRLVAGKGLYRYKNRIVTVTIDEMMNRAEIKDMIPHRFRTWVEIQCGIVCYKEHSAKNVGVWREKQTMGVEHAQTCLASDEFTTQQPRLVRVNAVRLPIQRRNGDIVLLPEGYDAESGILTLPQAWEYDEDMTAAQGLTIWENVIKEMPWQDERSRAVFFAALFGQFAYFLQPIDARRVNFLMHANASRSGKTLLVEIILTVAWGYATIDNMPEDAGKLRDRLDTSVREAKTYLVLDDLEQTFLKSGLLNAFMTATWWGGRKFHSQEEFQEPKTPVVFMTANNLDITPDIAGRTLICDLFTAEADAQARKVDRDIDAEWVRSPEIHRQLCSALWAMLKIWRDGTDTSSGGRQQGKTMIRGYEAWSRIYGGIVSYLGIGDPCQARKVDGTGNSEYNDMLAMITVLAADVAKVHEFQFEELVQVCRAEDCFPHIVQKHGRFHRVRSQGQEDRQEYELSGAGNSQLGKLFAKYGGKLFVLKDGRKVVFDKHGKNRHRKYRLEVSAAATPAAK